MKIRHRALLVIVAIVVSPVILCSGYFTYYIISHAVWLLQAQARVQSLNESLPGPSGSTLVQTITGRMGGGTAGCVVYGAARLYGTDNSTIEEVFRFYKSTLLAEGWNQDLEYSDGISFDLKRLMFLNIYEPTEVVWEYEYDTQKYISNKEVNEARDRYRTVYIVSFFTYWTPSWLQQCAGG